MREREVWKGIRGLIYLPPPLLSSKAQRWTGKCSWQRLKNVSHTPTYTYLPGYLRSLPTRGNHRDTDYYSNFPLRFSFSAVITLSSYSSTCLFFKFGYFYEKKKQKSTYDSPISKRKKFQGKYWQCWNLLSVISASVSVCLYLFVSAPFYFGLFHFVSWTRCAFPLHVFQSAQICFLKPFYEVDSESWREFWELNSMIMHITFM